MRWSFVRHGPVGPVTQSPATEIAGRTRLDRELPSTVRLPPTCHKRMHDTSVDRVRQISVTSCPLVRRPPRLGGDKACLNANAPGSACWTGGVGSRRHSLKGFSELASTRGSCYLASLTAQLPAALSCAAAGNVRSSVVSVASAAKVVVLKTTNAPIFDFNTLVEGIFTVSAVRLP